MKLNKFTAGAVAGASTLALAVPLMAQMVGAQSSTSTDVFADRPIPSQECTAAMANMEDAHLASFDEMQARHKEMMQTRVAGLRTASAIEDEAERGTALQEMHQTMKGNKADFEPSAEITAAMEEVRAACGDMMKMRGHGKGGHRGPMGGGMFFKRLAAPVGSDPVNVEVETTVQ
jgi:hypothetical protein